uniref:Uncharacterized protein n=1 Tax=Schistosoma japonicum TaxID=6182 RepID=Q5BZR0_SCHJA|nr:unknown [Schistosoma japonicum]
MVIDAMDTNLCLMMVMMLNVTKSSMSDYHIFYVYNNHDNQLEFLLQLMILYLKGLIVDKDRSVLLLTSLLSSSTSLMLALIYLNEMMT